MAFASAEIRWRLRSGDMRVQQLAGAVHYAVTPRSPFVVATAAGEAIVEGTQFSVEVRSMPSKKKVLMVGTPALIVGMVVMVSEGRVTVRNEHGSVGVVTGGEATASEEEAPVLVPPTAQARSAVSVGGVATPPPPRFVVPEPAVARKEVALKITPDAGAPAAATNDGTPKKFSDFSKDEWRKMAEGCELRYDLPGLARESAMSATGKEKWLERKDLASLGLSVDEEEILVSSIEKYRRHLHDVAASIYRDVVGDGRNVDDMDLQQLSRLLDGALKARYQDTGIDKSMGGEARRRIGLERAGDLAPPADPRQGTQLERVFRQLAPVGDDFEQMLAGDVSSARARELRDALAGRSAYSWSKGCPKR